MILGLLIKSLVHLFSTCSQTGHFSFRVGTGMNNRLEGADKINNKKGIVPINYLSTFPSEMYFQALNFM